MTQTAIEGDIFVFYDPNEELVVPLANGATIDAIKAYNQFRQEFGDDYDFVTFIVDKESGMPFVGDGSTRIYNDVTGIGDVAGANLRSDYGSNKLLRQTLHTKGYDNQEEYQPSIETLMHEIGHTWCFYIGPEGSPLSLLHEDWPTTATTYLLSQKPYHWGRWADNANSCMDYDESQWIDLGNGKFNRKYYGSDPAGSESDWTGFCPLDLYLMGLIPANEVPKISIVQNPAPPINDLFDGPYNPTPCVAQIDISDIVANEGNRNPGYMVSQRVFHEAWILITKDDTKPQAFFDHLNWYQKYYSKRFRQATGGRIVIDTSLLRVKIFSQEDYRELYFRDDENSGDIYGKNNKYFWDSPDLWVRNNDEGNAPTHEHQQPIPGQSNWIYASVNNAGGPPYKNVTVNIYLANWDKKFLPSTEFLYPVDWNPNGLIGSASNIQATPGTVVPPGKTIVKIEWKADQISNAFLFSHPCLLAEIIPMEVEPSKLHYVYENRKLAQRNLTIIDPNIIPPAGGQDTEPQPFMFAYEFMIGNRLRTSRTTQLQIKEVQGSEDLHLFLDPGELVKGLFDEAEEVEADIPLSPGNVPSSAMGIVRIKPSLELKTALISQPGDSLGRLSGITIGIPADTEIGILSSPEEALGPNTLRIKLCNDARIEVGYRKRDSMLTKKYELNGLKPVIFNGVPLLRITDPKNVSINLKLDPNQTPTLRLISIVSSRKNCGKKAIYDIVESLDGENLIGGLRLQVNL